MSVVHHCGPRVAVGDRCRPRDDGTPKDPPLVGHPASHEPVIRRGIDLVRIRSRLARFQPAPADLDYRANSKTGH